MNIRLNLPTRFNQYSGPLLLGVLCLFGAIVSGFNGDVLYFDRLSLNGHAYWQLVTANLVHTNSVHLALNMSGLALLWAIHGEHYRFKPFIYLSLWSGICVTSGIWLLSESMNHYAGLSGVLHGLFVFGALQDIKNRVKFGWLLMLGVWLKIFYEQLFGADQLVVNLIEAQVAVDAHLYGALAAVIWLTVAKLRP